MHKDETENFVEEPLGTSHQAEGMNPETVLPGQYPEVDTSEPLPDHLKRRPFEIDLLD